MTNTLVTTASLVLAALLVLIAWQLRRVRMGARQGMMQLDSN